MKKNLCPLFVVQLLILSFSQFVLPQNPMVTNASSIDSSENIVTEKGEFFGKQNFNVLENKDLFEPEVASINFDDIIIGNDNSTAISPNRYPRVAFYSPYPNNNSSCQL